MWHLALQKKPKKHTKNYWHWIPPYYIAAVVDKWLSLIVGYATHSEVMSAGEVSEVMCGFVTSEGLLTHT